MNDHEQTVHDDIAANLCSVRERIVAACQRVSRDPGEVTLLPVSKTVSAERIAAAVRAGLTTFGENKVQEAREKAQVLASLGLRWSIIGRLQSNKIKYVARFAHEFQALDCLSLAETLQRRLDIEDRTLDVFVQINSSGEASKFGVPPDRAKALVQEMRVFDRLRLRGLMTLAVFSRDEERVRSCFQRMRLVRERLHDAAPPDGSVEELSMGMSGDFECAIEEGATILRIGQAIFGPRKLPDSHYWPEN